MYNQLWEYLKPKSLLKAGEDRFEFPLLYFKSHPGSGYPRGREITPYTWLIYYPATRDQIFEYSNASGFYHFGNINPVARQIGPEMRDFELEHSHFKTWFEKLSQIRISIGMISNRYSDMSRHELAIQFPIMEYFIHLCWGGEFKEFSPVIDWLEELFIPLEQQVVKQRFRDNWYNSPYRKMQQD